MAISGSRRGRAGQLWQCDAREWRPLLRRTGQHPPPRLRFSRRTLRAGNPRPPRPLPSMTAGPRDRVWLRTLRRPNMMSTAIARPHRRAALRESARPHCRGFPRCTPPRRTCVLQYGHPRPVSPGLRGSRPDRRIRGMGKGLAEPPLCRPWQSATRGRPGTPDLGHRAAPAIPLRVDVSTVDVPAELWGTQVLRGARFGAGGVHRRSEQRRARTGYPLPLARVDDTRRRRPRRRPTWCARPRESGCRPPVGRTRRRHQAEVVRVRRSCDPSPWTHPPGRRRRWPPE